MFLKSCSSILLLGRRAIAEAGARKASLGGRRKTGRETEEEEKETETVKYKIEESETENLNKKGGKTQS